VRIQQGLTEQAKTKRDACFVAFEFLLHKNALYYFIANFLFAEDVEANAHYTDDNRSYAWVDFKGRPRWHDYEDL